MKPFYKSMLLVLLFSPILVACKSDQSKSYKAYYQTINKEYAKVREAQAMMTDENGNDLDANDPARDEMASMEKELAEAQAEAQAYREAMERAFPQKTPLEDEEPMIKPDKGLDLSKQTPPSKKQAPRVEEDMNLIFREYDVTPMAGYENAQLKRYNVVIATLSREEGVERLKRSLASTNENITVVKNDTGLYSFVVGSFDSREKALNKRRNILSSYSDVFSKQELMSKYEIPFADTWILIKK